MTQNAPNRCFTDTYIVLALVLYCSVTYNMPRRVCFHSKPTVDEEACEYVDSTSWNIRKHTFVETRRELLSI
jgi:hypothetical protein